MGISITAFVPAVSAAIQDIVHPGLRALTYSIVVLVQHLLGTALGPIVIGSISDAYGIETALKVLPAFLVTAAALFFVGSFLFNKDFDKVENVDLQME